ncbi:MAG TPA: hypothetical protein VJR58_26905 [Vineibacter sp.]|nr:hypothetical protein [Vineibacter sp.]
MLERLGVVLLACTLIGACSVRSEKTVVAPAGASESCQARGYQPGTSAYNDCLARAADRR